MFLDINQLKTTILLITYPLRTRYEPVTNPLQPVTPRYADIFINTNVTFCESVAILTQRALCERFHKHPALCGQEYDAHLRALWWQTLCRRPRVSRCIGATRNCIYSTHKHYVHLYNSVNSGSSWAFSELLCIKMSFIAQI